MNSLAQKRWPCARRRNSPSIAMGKLGGREMTAGSDLDLIFVYEVPAHVEISDGPKPLPVIVYYARLAQRFISALTTPTAAGTLYDVDMRLRPTGNKGPVAVSLQFVFERYHAGDPGPVERHGADAGARGFGACRSCAAKVGRGDPRHPHDGRRATAIKVRAAMPATCATSWRRSFPAAIAGT